MSIFNESWPWKRDLANAAERLERARLGVPAVLDQAFACQLFTQQRPWTSQLDGADSYEAEIEALYLVERDVMNGAFAVRRLIGMPSKVTKATRETKARVVRYPLRVGAKAPDVWDALGDLDMYDMEAPAEVVVTANEVCNLFIHSLIMRFAWTLESLALSDWWALDESDPRVERTPDELAGWLVASDRSSTQHLTFIPLRVLVRVMRLFAEDEVTMVTNRRDPQGRMHSTAS